MNVLNHISYITCVLQLIVKIQKLKAKNQIKVKIFFYSDNVNSIITTLINAKYCQYWELLTVFWQEIIVNSQRMNEFKKHINFIVMSLLRELRGYNILYFGYIGYYFEKNLESDNVTPKITIPIKEKKSQQ